MRWYRTVCILLIFFCLPLSAKAGQLSVALVFDSGPNGKYTQQLLDGLYDRGIQGTFLLQGYRMEAHPEILQQICRDSHEVVFRGNSGDALSAMSRRAVAEELIHCQSLLPTGISPRFFCPNGSISDGVRQVARARNLSLLGWSAEPANWPSGAYAPRLVRDGDILLLSDRTSRSVEFALSLADQLLEADAEILTVSQLAKQQGMQPRPGNFYSCFPES